MKATDSKYLEAPQGTEDLDISKLHESLKSLISDKRPSLKYVQLTNEPNQRCPKYLIGSAFLITVYPKLVCHRSTIDAAKKRLEKIISLDQEIKSGSDEIVTHLKNERFPCILLDIANYEDLDLVQNSLLLLDRYYSSESSIFHKALKSQLLETKQSRDLYDRILNGEDDEIDGLKMVSIEELTESCWLEEDVKGYEPHQINQSIILSFGNNYFVCQNVVFIFPNHRYIF